MLDISTPRGFPTREFEHRLEKAQYLMRSHGLDGILLTSEAELRYFSGFMTQFWQSPTRPWFMFLPLEGKPVAVIPEIGHDLMSRTWLDDIRTWSSPEPEDDGISLLHELLSLYAQQRCTIGIMKGAETSLRMPLADYEHLMTRLPGLNLVDATPIIKTLRMTKSEAEIEKIGHICAIASLSFAQAHNLFSEGQSLQEAFRAFKVEILKQGADDIPYLVGGAGKGGYRDVISPPTEQPLQSGDILMLDTGSVFDGYYCDFDRNFAINSADDDARATYETLYRATEAGLNAARPGTSCKDLFCAMQNVIDTQESERGNVGRLGHGLGMQLTEWPSHAMFDDTILQENMVITLEPSMSYGEGKIMVHEENLVVRDGPPLLLSTRAPAEIPVIG